MNREQDAGKEQTRHISMELTADGARVVNLSLDGSRLVLTIEAELAGSQLRSVDNAPKPRPSTEKSDTEFVFSPSRLSASGDAVALDDTVVADSDDEDDDDVMRDTTGEPFGGSEAVRPRPESESPVFSPEPPDMPPPPAAPQVLEVARPAGGGSRPREAEAPQSAERLNEAPPLEPVREVTDTWDNAGGAEKTTRLVLNDDDPAAAAPEPESAGNRDAGASPERLAVNSTAQPVEDMPASLLGGIEETFQPSRPPAPPAPVMTPVLDTEPSAPEARFEPSILSEESAIVGGERHGEPQPGIAFGMEPPAPAPETARPAAPVPASEPPRPAPGPDPLPPPAPQPAPKAPTPDASPRYGDNFITLPAGGALRNDAPRVKTPEAAGTTVLIRYTCPKCKTQGMQAVDKVGTVVNCSNCGKAMRLVIKK